MQKVNSFHTKYQGMRAARITPNGGAYIEMKHLGVDLVKRNFKGMVDRCSDCGFDLAAGRVEVVPTAHYMMGGVEFSGDTSTALPGLFAAGEDTGGVHGANRLGGNGVANSTVYDGISGDAMAAYVVREGAWREPDSEQMQSAAADCERPFQLATGDTNALREALYNCMWDDVGISRNAQGLARASSLLDGLQDQLQRTGVGGVGSRAFHLSWHDWLNLNSLITVSRTIVLAAQARENSRGAHFREDFPDAGDLFVSTYTKVQQTDGSLGLTTAPVQFTRVKPGESLIT
jgi:fumarate reductase flavoprotein subunit